MTDFPFREDQISRVPFSGCWIWMGALNTHGYSWVSRKGRWMAGSRYVYQQMNGPIPPKMNVCHRCDVRACVNPDHLFLGTQADNVKDMMQKGRFRHPRLSRENHPRAKLTETNVAWIKEMLAADANQYSIAAVYGVSRSLIKQIKRGEIWK